MDEMSPGWLGRGVERHGDSNPGRQLGNKFRMHFYAGDWRYLSHAMWPSFEAKPNVIS